MSQREFARVVGIKQPQLARLESGKEIPKIQTLIKIARQVGYNIEVRVVREKPINEHDSSKIPCNTL